MLSNSKNLALVFLLTIILFSLSLPLTSAENVEENEKILMHYFYMDGCSDCAAQERFIKENLVDEYSYLEIHKHDLQEKGTIELMDNLAAQHGIDDIRHVAPTTFINGYFFRGFSERDAERMIQIVEDGAAEESDVIEIPFLGEIHPEDLPLPILAFVLGFGDGMNVCSIGALVMVLMIVLTFDSRKKIFFYGFLFLLTVISVYGLIIFVWYHVLDTIMRHIGLLRYIIGAAGIIGGAVFFKQFVEFYKQGPQCSYDDAGLITKARMKVKESFEGEHAGLLGITSAVIFFAAVVTLIELPCSAALPLVFSGVLVDTQLTGLTYVFYIALYLFFYMLIELIIFTGAVITKEIWFGSGKFATGTTLAGSLILFVLGISYLFGLV